MCGIIAYLLGNCNYNKHKNVKEVILNGLKQLQNRGYDSTGVIFTNHIESKYFSYKVASNVKMPAIKILEEELMKIVETDKYFGGIGHTRWATHGGKTDINAHPHIDQTQTIAVVHNGIIENYQELKRELQENDYNFLSETDSEVIVQLISYYHYVEKKTITESIKITIDRLEGTWGLAIINLRTKENQEPELFLSRKGSPLLISFEEDHIMVASEESAFQNLVSEFSPLKDHDLIAIKRNGLDKDTKFEIKFLGDTKKLQNHKNKVKKDIQIQLPPHYQHWTLKEIWETPMSCLRAYNNGGRLLDKEKVKLGGLESIQEQLLTRKNLVLLGCGTSYHAGLLARKYFEKLSYSGFETIDVIDASEFEEQQLPNVSSEKILLVHLSQSGETRDLQKCLEIGRKNNYLQIGVINVVDSLIARDVDAGCYINAGREVGVASTKSFLNQVIVLGMIAIWFSQNRDCQNITKQTRQRMIQDLRKLVFDLEKVLQNSSLEIQELANNIKKTGFKSLYLLGKGNSGVALAKEGALKIKELAYYHCEGSSCSSLKHGPFGLLEDNYPVVLIALRHPTSDIVKIKNSFQEIISRNAKVFLITDLDNTEEFNLAYQIIKIPENATFQELVAIIPIQLLAYYLSIIEGNNPDFPRNLAKVVTVE